MAIAGAVTIPSISDEPTGIDLAPPKRSCNYSKHQQKTRNNILLVTHDSDVAQQCSRILRMEDGQIVSDERGSEEE